MAISGNTEFNNKVDDESIDTVVLVEIASDTDWYFSSRSLASGAGSDGGVNYDDYNPIIKSVSPIFSSLPDLRFGIANASDVEIGISNTNPIVSNTIQAAFSGFIENQIIVIKLGFMTQTDGDTFLLSDFIPLWTGLVEDYNWNEELLNFICIDSTFRRHTKLPAAYIEASGVDVPGDNVGKPYPINYGNITKAIGYITKETAKAQTAHFSEASDVNFALNDLFIYMAEKFVNLDENLTSTVYFTRNANNSIITWGSDSTAGNVAWMGLIALFYVTYPTGYDDENNTARASNGDNALNKNFSSAALLSGGSASEFDHLAYRLEEFAGLEGTVIAINFVGKVWMNGSFDGNNSPFGATTDMYVQFWINNSSVVSEEFDPIETFAAGSRIVGLSATIQYAPVAGSITFPSTSTIADSTSQFLVQGFAIGMKIAITHTTGTISEGVYEIQSVTANLITITTSGLTISAISNTYWIQQVSYDSVDIQYDRLTAGALYPSTITDKDDWNFNTLKNAYTGVMAYKDSAGNYADVYLYDFQLLVRFTLAFERIPNNRIYGDLSGAEYGSWIDNNDNGYNEDELIEQPAYIIESLYRDRLSLVDADIDETNFDIVGNTTDGTRDGWIFSGQILNQEPSRDIIDKLAKSAMLRQYKRNDDTESLKSWESSIASSKDFDSSTIVKVLKFGRVPMNRVFNEFRVNYNLNRGNGVFQSQIFVTATDSNFASEDSVYRNRCANSQNDLGWVNPMDEFNAYWIEDAATAELLIKQMVLFYARRPYETRFLSFLKDSALLEMLDIITLDYSRLPTEVRGSSKKWEIVDIQKDVLPNAVTILAESFDPATKTSAP